MKNVTSDTTYNYVPTRVNGERLFTGASPTNREVWIKIETVDSNATTGAIVTKDITEDILSLGVTEVAPSTIDIKTYSGSKADNGTPTAPSANITATTPQTATTYPDSRSIVNLQRWALSGPAIPRTGTTDATSYVYSWGPDADNQTTVALRYTAATSNAKVTGGCVTSGSTCTAANLDPNSGSLENWSVLKRADFSGTGGTNDNAIVPFPIEMFDSREGEWYDDDTKYDSTKLTWNGVMSMVDIDVANVRRFLRGDFDGLFPATTNFPSGLKSTDIPQRQGWVFYVSDRRGDADFDGEYDMEDTYGSDPSGNNGTLDKGEDANNNGTLEAKFMTPGAETCVGSATTCEAAKYADTVAQDLGSVDEHKYYRRGVRLMNGTTLPGKYDSTTAANTRGFTFASENGVYVLGNYNATGVASIPSTGNTPSTDYQPSNTALHIPASIVATR